MSYYDAVYEIVRKIPKGKVATYGQIAIMTGSPRAARAVGYALHANRCEGEIPCHRVVNRVGRLAPAFAFGGAQEQRRRLEAEGIALDQDGFVDLARFRWDGLNDCAG